MKLNILKRYHRKKLNRSRAMTFFIYLMLLLIACFMSFPMVYAVSNSLKPIEELFLFPPRIFVINPTFDNYLDLFDIISNPPNLTNTFRKLQLSYKTQENLRR